MRISIIMLSLKLFRMKKIFFAAVLSTLFSQFIFASVGDTTTIAADTVFNLAGPPSNDHIWIQFPNTATTYQKIVMKVTMGCGIPTCSHWDYTVNAQLGKKSGTLDSSIVSIDTVAHDTTWSYTDHIDYIEVGRLITPYGNYMDWGTNGFNSAWTQPYYYEVTDYASFLKDSVDVMVHYDGWSDAFSARVEFIFVEGPPSRTVESVREIYHSYYGYANSTDFENQVTPQSFFIAPTVTSAKVNVIMTGHGNQGEFDPRNIHIKINGAEVYTRLLWRADCDIQPVAPQGGTWIFHRANWCPGDKVNMFEADISPFVTAGQNVSVDLDLDDFVIQPGAGAGYGISAHLITFTNQHNNDVMMDEIIAPNSDKPYLHHNPISTKPIVKIKNMGQNQLDYAEISYWVKGGQKWYYEWHGHLKTYETETITLPAFSWNGLDTNDRVFYAEAKWPNQVPDEYDLNDKLGSSFNMAPKLDSTFFIYFVSNNHPEENWYIVRNEDGDTMDIKTTFPVSAARKDTLLLNPGSYAFDFNDYDSLNWGCGDGLSFFINQQDTGCTNHPTCNETAGQLSLRKINNPLIKSFNAESGANIHYEFTVGYPLGFNAPKTPPAPPIHTGIADIPAVINLHVFPNPAESILNVTVDLSRKADGQLDFTDALGRTLKTFALHDVIHTNLQIPVKDFAAGIYLLRFHSAGAQKTVKVLVR